MENLRNILYVERQIAGCGRAFSCALDLAHEHQAELTVAGVVAPKRSWDVFPLELRERPTLDSQRRRWDARLKGLANRRGNGQTPIGVRVLLGEASDMILREVVRQDHDLLVKVNENARSPWPWSVGGLDRRLLRGCPCPVWILDPAQGPGIRLILAAVDVGLGGDPELNAKVVRTAASLSKRTGAELRLVHAWSIVGEPILASSMTGISPQRMRALRREIRRERIDRLRRLLDESAFGVEARIKLAKGDPVRVIQREARRTEADLVVVGNATHKGLEALLFGNVAERLIGRFPGSVLSVRAVPPGRPSVGSMARQGAHATSSSGSSP